MAQYVRSECRKRESGGGVNGVNEFFPSLLRNLRLTFELSSCRRAAPACSKSQQRYLHRLATREHLLLFLDI